MSAPPTSNGLWFQFRVGFTDDTFLLLKFLSEFTSKGRCYAQGFDVYIGLVPPPPPTHASPPPPPSRRHCKQPACPPPKKLTTNNSRATSENDSHQHLHPPSRSGRRAVGSGGQRRLTDRVPDVRLVCAVPATGGRC